MNLPSTSAVPPGWYPDPSGARQWRVWTGTMWSELTRPYGEPVVTAPVVASLALISALHRLVRYGIVATFAGLGLVVSVLAHWPGTHQPTPLWFAETASDAGVALLVVGSVLYALALRELEGSWSLYAVLPGLNVLAAGALVTQRLAHRPQLLRLATQAALLGLFIAFARAQPWLCVAPVLVALDHYQWTSSLLDRLTAPATVPAPSAP
jgi:hypothetical protein